MEENVSAETHDDLTKDVFTSLEEGNLYAFRSIVYRAVEGAVSFYSQTSRLTLKQSNKT